LRFFHPDFLSFLQEPSGEGVEEFLRCLKENRIGRREILLFLLNQEIRQGAIAGNHALERSQIWIRTPYVDEDFVAGVFRAPGCPAGKKIGERLLHRSTGDRIGYRLRGELRADPCKSLQRWILSCNEKRLLKIPINLGEEPLAWSGINGLFWRIYSRTRGLADKFYDNFEYPGITAPVDRLFQRMGLQSFFAGFSSYVNYRIWMMAELRDYVREILLDSRTLGRGFYNRRFLERAVNDHCVGRQCYSSAFIKLVSFELWNRLFVDNGSSSRQEEFHLQSSIGGDS
jgi:asparagine synthase (glutamine-hydrolysing)